MMCVAIYIHSEFNIKTEWQNDVCWYLHSVRIEFNLKNIMMFVDIYIQPGLSVKVKGCNDVCWYLHSARIEM